MYPEYHTTYRRREIHTAGLQGAVFEVFFFIYFSKTARKSVGAVSIHQINQGDRSALKNGINYRRARFPRSISRDPRHRFSRLENSTAERPSVGVEIMEPTVPSSTNFPHQIPRNPQHRFSKLDNSTAERPSVGVEQRIRVSRSV